MRRGTRPAAGACAACAALLLAGCRVEPLAPQAVPTFTPSATLPKALASLLPTLGVTPSAAPTLVAATPTPRFFPPPGTGELLIRESFDGGAAGWSTSSSVQGAAVASGGALVLSVNLPRYSQTSEWTRAGLADFYAEVTSRTIFCRGGKDTFGLVFRSAAGESYRLAAACDGTLRFERLAGVALVGASRWQPAPSLLPGAPAENRLGVLCRGSEFRFFANGMEVLVVTDPLLPSGNLGVFVKTEDGAAMTVGFDDLTVYAVDAP